MSEIKKKLWSLIKDYVDESEWLIYYSSTMDPDDEMVLKQVEKRDIAEAKVILFIEKMEV